MANVENSRTDAYLLAAREIGHELCRDAIWSGKACNWLGDSKQFEAGSWRTVCKSLGPEIYSGTSGIAWFLASLYQATRESLFRDTAIAALEHAVDRSRAIEAEFHPSFFSGWVGIAYVTTVAGDILGCDRLRAQARSIVSQLAQISPEGMDVVNGVAGSIPALLALARLDRFQDANRYALDWARLLLHRGVVSKRGLSWSTMGSNSSPLTGLSHGNAGIALALAEAGRFSGERQFLQAAHEAVRFENHYFSPTEGNWQDLREGMVGPSIPAQYSTTWCHGAPGILLSRLRLCEICQSETIISDYQYALHTTLRSISQRPAAWGNFSLCHGLFGNADIVLTSAIRREGPELIERLKQIAKMSIAIREERGFWPCGVDRDCESPGFMLGKAGIGHFLLRLWRPELSSLLLVSVA